VKAIGGKIDNSGHLTGIICEDQRTKEKFNVTAKHFVSSVGPWTDIFAESVFKKWKSILRPTKGVHLTFKKERLPLNGAVVMGAEKRIVFGIPRHEMVIIGTTDTDFQGDPAAVTTTPEDVRYLLSVVDKYFPGAKIKESDIVASYAGVRPLVQDQAESEGKTSREHVIFTEDHGVTFVAGGKYTTYRLMSQQVVEECLKFFPIEDKVRFDRCLTTEPLNRLVTVDSRKRDEWVVEEIAQSKKMTRPEAVLLVERHGLEALEIFKKFGPDSYWALEAKHAIENTMCLHLVDFYARRVPLFLSEQDHGLSLLPLISDIFAKSLGWNASEKAAEESLLHQHMAHELAWRHKNA
jgi:glycerol-3-phosphate dehydrogenase